MKRSPFFCDIMARQPSLGVAQGWEVANHFTSPEEEHHAVRRRVGLFDWSTTGEIEVQGPDALALVQRLIVNDAAPMPIHRVLYTTILNPDGGIMSDITVYRLGPQHYLLMTAWGSNAAGGRPEYELLVEQSKGLNVAITDVSSGSGLLALQGPLAPALLGELTTADLSQLHYMWATPAQVVGIRVLISRTGYTGEIGYEILIPAEHAHDLWEALLAAGQKHGLAPCGMTVAFSLRIEKGYIMRFDFAGGRTPYEAGLGWTVKLDKGDFIGRQALVRRKEAGFAEKLVALTVEDGYVPANGDAIWHGEAPAGSVTSAAFGWTVGKPVALGYVPLALAQAGVAVAVRDKAGTAHAATVAHRPLYDPENSRLRCRAGRSEGESPVIAALAEARKARVLAELTSARRRILDVARALPTDKQTKVFLGTWSAADLLAHLIGWDHANIEAFRELLEGRLPSFYAYHDHDWQSFNAILVTEYGRDEFGALIRASEEALRTLVDFVSTIPAVDVVKDRGVRFRGRKVTIERLLAADARDVTDHAKQLISFAGQP